MGGKKKKTVIGYKYLMGLFMGICRGPIDALRQIRVGGKVAWQGKVSANGRITIHQPKLFGGDEQEGGIDGTLDVMLGAKDQPRNESLAAMLGGLVSAFRGVTTTFFDGLVCAMSPYPKEWEYLVQKTKAGWHGEQCWYPEKCEIILLDGSVELLGAGWEYQIEHFTEPNTVWNNFAFPTEGWLQGGDLPFSTNGMEGGPYWTPTRSNIWLRRKIHVKAIGLTLNVAADNGCIVWINGINVGVSNASNENIQSNEKNPVTYELSALGIVEVVIKAYAEINKSDEGGNSVNVTFSGDALVAMNPAHILRRIYTDPIIGRGLPESRLDEAAWRAAADQFHAEGFGLCLKWARTDSIAEFAKVVIDHVGAVVYPSRRTGKIVIKAIRDDYDVNGLPLFTPETGLLGFDDDQSSAQAGGINEVIVKWFDPVEKKEQAVREKNLGAILAAGSVTISREVSYPGLPTEALARRVARRDLQAGSGVIKKFTVRLDRRGVDIMPGHVFRIADASRGIANIVLRAGRVEYGTPTDGTITVTGLQDVFSLPATVYRASEENGYLPPDTSIHAAALQTAMEVPYRELVQAMGASDLASLPDGAGYLHAAAVRPTTLSQSFALQTRVPPAPYTSAADMALFCPGGRLAAPLDYLDTTVLLQAAQALDELEPGSAALIGSEIVRVDAVDVATATLTIARGCADTVPAQHVAGTAVLCYDSWGGDDQTEYTTGVSVEAVLLTNTGAGQLPLGTAPVQTVTFASRAMRPYPPANVQINGERYPAKITGNLLLTWSHRDRIIQADNLVDTLQGSIGPEQGTTYCLETYDELGTTPLATVSDIASTQASWTPPGDGKYRVELYSKRDTWDCMQRFVHVVQVGPELWTPAKLTDAAKIWLDDESGITLVSGECSQWNDRTGHGFHFSQSTATQRPTVVNEALNGRRVIRFDGNNDRLTNSSSSVNTLFSAVNQGWMFSVYRRRATSSKIACLLQSRTSGGGAGRFACYAGSNVAGYENAGSLLMRRLDSDTAGALRLSENYGTDWAMVMFRASWANGTGGVTLNGQSEVSASMTSSGNTQSTPSDIVCLGSEGTTTYADVDMACVLVGSGSQPTAAEIDKIFGWAAHRFGLASSLPTAHPYKESPPIL